MISIKNKINLKEGILNKMNNYIDTLNETIKSYYKILSEDFPEFLNEYINTPAMLKQSKISVSCGTIYSKMYNQMWYSSLDHSIAVALIIWHFTKDKKQTLSGLFHDIATPVFKHSIDFMNKDYEKQESTEELTTKIIQDSEELMYLLNRDSIKVEEVADYHIYPIADNDTPRLSSDRLEYTLSNGLGATEKLWTLEEVKEIYDNIEIQKDENGIDELGFKTEKIANEFVWMTSKLSIIYREDKTRYSMQFIADILKKLNEEGIIKRSDLYTLKESEVIEIIEKSKYCCVFDKWRRAKSIFTSLNAPKDVYYVHHGAKIRYIDPLVNFSRISKISKSASEMIQNNLSYDMSKYVYLYFDI